MYHLTVNHSAAATTKPPDDFSTSTGGVAVHPGTSFTDTTTSIEIIGFYLNRLQAEIYL
jgi:hypothetical protein